MSDNDGFLLGFVLGALIAIISASFIDDFSIHSNIFVDTAQTLCKANEGPKTVQTITTVLPMEFRITCNNGAVFEVPLPGYKE